MARPSTRCARSGEYGGLSSSLTTRYMTTVQPSPAAGTAATSTRGHPPVFAMLASPQTHGVDLAALLTKSEGSEIACAIMDFVDVGGSADSSAGGATARSVAGPNRTSSFPIRCWPARCRFHGAASLSLQLGQQPGHFLGMLGHRAGQHGADLRDIGAARAEHQAQVGFLEARCVTPHRSR